MTFDTGATLVHSSPSVKGHPHFIHNFLDSITRHLPVLLVSTNSHGIVNFVDGNCSDKLSVQKHELVGESIFEVPSLFSKVHHFLRQALGGDEVTTRFTHNGYILRLWISPVRGDDGISGITATAIDVTEHEEIEQALSDIQRHYLLLAEHSSDLITKYTPEGVCTYASPSLNKVLGYRPDELLGGSAFDLFHPEDNKSKRRAFTKLLDTPSEESVCYRVRHKSEKYIWLETRTKAIRNGETGEIMEIVCVSRDITARKESEERLLYLANYDSLTGLPNRALFRDRLRRAIARAQRNKTKVALMFLDLDRFKTINDSLGHHAGDQLLRSVSRRLKQQGREGDTIARLGGDEFTVILEGIHDQEDATKVAEKILELMQSPFRLDGHEVVVTPSIGITIFPDDASDMRSLLKNADTAMYRSKEQGRNGFHFYTADMNAKAYESLLLENNLRHAMERNELRLFFQPQIDLHSQAIIGMEALLRWEHPEQGLLQPESFIPFAEETGLIIPLGKWVLRTACEQARQWSKSGFSVRVAVNLSMYQFIEQDFVSHVTEALQATDLPPQLLELEITESFLAQNVDHAAETLRQLHGLGVHLSVDDFGTGYSSLSYLKQFPLNTLKIDRSFVSDISHDPDSTTIAEAIIALGKSLRLNVIAEGVETEEQVFFLRNHGCDLVQGFLFSHPMSAEKVMGWLRRNRQHQAHYEQWALWPETLG